MNPLFWVILALTAAVVAGLFGFSGMENRGTSIGQVLFIVLLIMAGFLFLFSIRGFLLP